MVTISTISEEPWFTTISTIFWILEIVTSLAVDYFIAFLRVIDKKDIETILALWYSFPIETILGLKTSECEVAVFIVPGKICVVGIFWIEIVDTEQRHSMHKIIKLFKKSAVKIKFLSIIKSTPFITPPNSMVIYGILFVRWINRNNLISCLVALSVVEFSFISPGESPALSFLWRKRWSWYWICFTSKNGWDFFVKFSIFISHKKIFSRNFAFFGFYYLFSRGYKTHKIW